MIILRELKCRFITQLLVHSFSLFILSPLFLLNNQCLTRRQRECTVVYRSYLDTFLQEQINNVEPGSPSDAFYGFETRLSPELRLKVLQGDADWFKTSDSIEWTKCELEDTSFGEDE